MQDEVTPGQDFSDLPTIFHITHWKAGSQWIYDVFRAIRLERVVVPKVKVAHFLEDPIIPGMIYPTVYVNRTQFESVSIPENSIKFVVIRDLRDSCVSRYFSVKISHPVISDVVAKGRAALADKSTEEGLLYIIRTMTTPTALIQSSWIDSGELMVRYEDLIADEYSQFKRIFDHCQIVLDEGYLQDLVIAYGFENQSGRKKGVEEVSSHFRKAIAGDWRNHFTDRVKDEFKERFGDLLIQTGYEKDYDW